MEHTVCLKITNEIQSNLSAAKCRRMLVGPGVNQPDPFPGYNGFVGWEAVIRLKNGTWLVTFNAGYWHASPRVQPIYENALPWVVEAPTGGRAMIIKSEDEGVTWSKPETLVDTPDDDRHPCIYEAADGTLICTFFTYGEDRDREGEVAKSSAMTYTMRSFDGGRTWTEPERMDTGFTRDATDGPIIALNDGSLLLAIYGKDEGKDEHYKLAIMRSTDVGLTWKRIAVVEADHTLEEPGIAQLPDGHLVMIARPYADVCFSDDGGYTWTKPAPLCMGKLGIFACNLLCLDNGVLICTHGNYATHGGVYAILSADGGHTWLSPSKKYGFSVDPDVYGYTQPMLLPDGSIFAVYLDNQGIRMDQIRREAVWGVRMRVREDLSGIEMLPAPGVDIA
ncbi:glycoside hydrolase [bacterium]|nr:glycoside hydrolase [bacterium]